MKIAITGGAGFIGRRLVELLKKDGHECVIIDTAALTPVDIENPDAMIKACAGCDAIYHLAAAHRDDIFPRSRYYDVNVTGTENVILAAQKNGIEKIIFTSTFAVYGLDGGTPDESSKPAPFNDYGRSKLDAEARLKDWAEDDPARSVTIVRPVVVFGEGNRGNVHTLIDQISRGRFVMVGSGKNKKSMAYVGNVAGFLHHCLTLDEGFRVYNYADKPDYSMQELTDILYTKLAKSKPVYHLPYLCGLGAGYAFDILARVSGRRFPISAVRVQKFCADTTCKAEKLKETGFSPKFSLEDGLTRMIVHDFSGAAPQSMKQAA